MPTGYQAARPYYGAWRFVLVTVLLAGALSAQDEFERIRPKEPPRQPKIGLIVQDEGEPTGDTKPLGTALKGVVFLRATDGLLKDPSMLSGIQTDRVPLLDNDEFRSALQGYLGKPVSLRSIEEMARLAVLHHRMQDRPVVDVLAPEQDITAGVVQLIVLEARAGKVSIEGNRWFGENTLRPSISTHSGDILRTTDLHRQLDRLNKNSFRSVNVQLKPGGKQGESDVTFRVDDRFPVRFYGGYEDTGNVGSGRDRIIEGFNWGNAFLQGHELCYQHTSSFNFENFTGHAMEYHVPLPIHGHDLTAFGSWAKERWGIDTGRELDIAWQIGLRYRIALPGFKGCEHAVRYGFDYKRMDIDQDGAAKSITDTIQFVLQYEGTQQDAWGSTSFSLAGAVSPGGLSDRNDARNFGREREGARARYVYGNLSVERTWTLPSGITLQNRVMTQRAGGRLLGSEQLSFGGYQNVRGYDEAEVPADQGLFCSVELRSPEFMLGRFAGADRFENRLQFIAFFDAGFADIKSRRIGEEGSVKLEGTGAGLRYRMGDNVSLRLDYAFKLKDTGGGRDEKGRFHIGFTVGF